MTDAIRTPDELTQGLPDFPFEPHYREVDGFRVAHLDEGDGPAGRVLARRADVVVPVAQGHPAGARRGLPLHRARPAGLRALRQAGRPRLVLATTATPTYGRSLVEDLDLRDATFVVHDWGGPVGLRVAIELPDRVDRLVILDTGLFTGHQRMSDAWKAFRDFVERTEDLPISFLVDGACATDLPDEVKRRLRRAVPQRRRRRRARARSR